MPLITREEKHSLLVKEASHLRDAMNILSLPFRIVRNKEGKLVNKPMKAFAGKGAEKYETARDALADARNIAARKIMSGETAPEFRSSMPYLQARDNVLSYLRQTNPAKYREKASAIPEFQQDLIISPEREIEGINAGSRGKLKDKLTALQNGYNEALGLTGDKALKYDLYPVTFRSQMNPNTTSEDVKKAFDKGKGSFTSSGSPVEHHMSNGAVDSQPRVYIDDTRSWYMPNGDAHVPSASENAIQLRHEVDEAAISIDRQLEFLRDMKRWNAKLPKDSQFTLKEVLDNSPKVPTYVMDKFNNTYKYPGMNLNYRGKGFVATDRADTTRTFPTPGFSGNTRFGEFRNINPKKGKEPGVVGYHVSPEVILRETNLTNRLQNPENKQADRLFFRQKVSQEFPTVEGLTKFKEQNVRDPGISMYDAPFTKGQFNDMKKTKANISVPHIFTNNKPGAPRPAGEFTRNYTNNYFGTPMDVYKERAKAPVSETAKYVDKFDNRTIIPQVIQPTSKKPNATTQRAPEPEVIDAEVIQ